MTNGRIALCLDELTCQNPELIGLEGERLDSQDWLDVFNRGDDMRKRIREGESFSEAWVVSCGDVEPINLAATLKSDRPELAVRLIVREGGGSLLSRAHTAQIDEVVGMSMLPRRYAEAKMLRKAAAANIPSTRQDHAVESAPAPEESHPNLPGESRVKAWQSDPAQTAPKRLDNRMRVAFDEGVDEASARPEETPTETRPIMAAARGQALEAEGKRGFIMPVVSGSGGAGKSSIAVLAALMAHDMGYRTLLLDYDLQFGDAAILAGIENPLTIDAALEYPARIEQEARSASGPCLIAPPNRLELSERIVDAMPAFLDMLTGIFDIIVANTGAAWAEQHAALLERSYTALFIIDQRSSSLWACKHALELCARCGIATGPFEFALNRCAKGSPLTAADVSCALQGAPVYELRDGGRAVEDYLGSGAAAELVARGNEFSESLRQVMGQILPGRKQDGDTPNGNAPGRKPGGFRGRHAGRRRVRKS